MSGDTPDIGRTGLGRRLTRRLTAFRRHKDGSAAVEFGLIAVPFIALTFAVIETGLIFFGGQVLETATQDASRLIMTGQAQNQSMSAAQFKEKLCAKLTAMISCDGVSIDVRTAASFAGANYSAPKDAGGNLDTGGNTFQPGQPGDVVVVRAMYEWPVLIRSFGLDLADLPNGKRLLMATAAFRNEPYK